MLAALERLRTLRVTDVMAKDVIEISEHQTMDEAAKELRRHGISSAPVIDEQGHCVGMFSAADYIKRECARDDNGPSAVSHQLGGVGHDALEISPTCDMVATYMSNAVQGISPTASLLDAARVMCGAHLHHLPVIDQDRVVGIVSTMDVAAAVVNAVDEFVANGAAVS